MQPLAASFWKIKENYEKEVVRASSAFEQKEKALRIRIEESRSEITTVNQQIQQAQAVKTDLESRINNAIATEALYSFIEKRTNSEDYRKHLGIVSMIRKDFEILSSLFLEHTSDGASKEQDIRSKFDCPLERIILYIDDLDRCPEDRVVEVLEAVNLLMAFPLFIVVVGVDPRWVKNALIKKHHIQFKEQLYDNKVSEQIEVIESSHYLEKIFQVAFHLREADENNVKYMLKTLSKSQKDTSSNVRQDENKMQVATTKSSQQYDSYQQDETNPFPSQLEADNEQVHQNIDTKVSDVSDYLILSDKEVASIQDFAKVIGNNPRSIKRFVNIYQIVRAHEDLRYSSQNRDKEFLVLMFLLSLSIGPFKKLTSAFRDFIATPSNEKEPLSTFLDQKYKIDSIVLYEMKNQFSIVMSDNNTFALLRDEQAATYLIHNKFIQRFTFGEF